MSDKFSETIAVVFRVRMVIFISIFSFVVKSLATEIVRSSLSFDQRPTNIIFEIRTIVSTNIFKRVAESLVPATGLSSDQWLTYIITTVIVFMMFFIFQISKLTENWLDVPSTYWDSKFIWFLTFATLFQTFSLASSSFVEEEHQTWYYMTHTFLIILCVMSLKKRQNEQWFLNAELLKIENRKKRINFWSLVQQFFVEFNWFALFAILLLGRRLNQTGDKWLNLPDLGDFLVMEQHRFWNSCFVVICKFTGVNVEITCRLRFAHL